ncbi:uncharacterized protein LTR77_004660 [Saxophila tyrrhenica]|uniref:Ketoreductase (KR) domain-containing protein n=1 Tax=Saxophila tyrrhenica TaxID=1690608 RepID=A0AAV9PHN3_9PEZI|nr:hypothetical protein LTR77_004660 [Saxophila tyrrhenica]
MASQHGALVVLGSGPGIGSHVAALFASRGFNKIVLMSRNAERLRQDASFVQSRAPDAVVEIVTIDLADSESVATALAEVDERLEGTKLECVLFNAARIGASKLLEWTPEQLENDLKVLPPLPPTLALLNHISNEVAQWAIPHLLKLAGEGKEGYKPSFLVTSGGLYKNPFPDRFSLAVQKAGQYNLVHSLWKAYNSQGVHCALIVVQGQVKKEAKVTTPEHIAECTWKLYDQEKGKGDLDVGIVDPDYNK